MAQSKLTKWIAISVVGLGAALVLIARPAAKLSPVPTPPAPAEVADQAKQELPAYLDGIDVSHYQGDIDWPMVAEQNLSFVFVKATDGITYTDPKFADNHSQALAQGLAVGAYHFFEPNDDGVKQAHNFLNSVKPHAKMLPPVLDVEINKGIEPELLQQRVQQWLDTVESALGCQPLLYSYDSFYENNLGTKFEKYRFWLADYAKKPTLPKGVDSWLFWQHTQSGEVRGITGKVDENLFQGDQQALNEIFCKTEAG